MSQFLTVRWSAVSAPGLAYLKLSSVSAARASFCVLRNTTMPAVLVETGFIDSADTQILTTHGDDIARALARGVTDYGQSVMNI